MIKRAVFFISDGTGITSENFGNSLLTQFKHIEFEKITIPYVNSRTQALAVKEKVMAAHQQTQLKPIIFSTLVQTDLRAILEETSAIIFDLFQSFLPQLAEALDTQPSSTVGQFHGIADAAIYNHRIDALNYALSCDDGLGVQYYEKADVILIGVSRSGKTPTSLYLALQFGIFTGNYPFTEDELKLSTLPKSLLSYKHKLFGLTIDPKRLQAIRHERRPEGRYASLVQCRSETQTAKHIYLRENIPFLDTTVYSIEEIATRILATMGLKRRIN